MTLKYFKWDMTEDEARNKHRDYNLSFHPDKNPSASPKILQEINAEYDEFKVIIKYLPEIRQFFGTKEKIVTKYIQVPVNNPIPPISEETIFKGIEKATDLIRNVTQVFKEVNKTYRNVRKPVRKKI